MSCIWPHLNWQCWLWCAWLFLFISTCRYNQGSPCSIKKKNKVHKKQPLEKSKNDTALYTQHSLTSSVRVHVSTSMLRSVQVTWRSWTAFQFVVHSMCLRVCLVPVIAAVVYVQVNSATVVMSLYCLTSCYLWIGSREWNLKCACALLLTLCVCEGLVLGFLFASVLRVYWSYTSGSMSSESFTSQQQCQKVNWLLRKD